jgi:hypothetical protein
MTKTFGLMRRGIAAVVEREAASVLSDALEGDARIDDIAREIGMRCARRLRGLAVPVEDDN